MKRRTTLAALVAAAGLVRTLAAQVPIVSQVISGPLVVTATPGTISFSASNPDAPQVAGTAAATISWWAGGASSRGWSLTVQADAASFLSCPAIPVSAVTVSCSQASVGSGGSGVCRSSMPLSTVPSVISSGAEGNQGAFYQVILRFTLTDSWKYIAQLSPPCSLSLTYVANLQ